MNDNLTFSEQKQAYYIQVYPAYQWLGSQPEPEYSRYKAKIRSRLDFWQDQIDDGLVQIDRATEAGCGETLDNLLKRVKLMEIVVDAHTRGMRTADLMSSPNRLTLNDNDVPDQAS